MKLYFNFASSLFFILPFVAFGQQTGMDAALSKGSAADMGVHFASKVDVSLPDAEASLTSADAVNTITGFFAQNPVKSYKRAHVTPSQNGRAGYSIGDLSTANGNFRIYLYYDDQKKISEVRIQK